MNEMIDEKYKFVLELNELMSKTFFKKGWRVILKKKEVNYEANYK